MAQIYDVSGVLGDTVNTESLAVIEDYVRRAISFPATRLRMIRDTEDFGHHVVYGLTAWFNRLAENRSLRSRMPATWRDWVKRGLLERWPWLWRWLDVRYVEREHEAWMIFSDLPSMPESCGVIRVFRDAGVVDGEVPDALG